MSWTKPACCLFLFLIGSVVHAQEFPGPEPEHEFLKKFAGTWKSNAECFMGEGKPPMKTESTIKARMIGPFWVVSEIDGVAGGATVKAMQTIGFDADKKKYVGTWVDSMLGYLWHYEGTLDESGKKLVLETTGPNFMTGKGTSKFRDVYEFKDDDSVLATSFVQDENGKWVQFVTAQTKRVKSEK